MLCAKAFDNRASVAAILRALELSMGRRRQRAIFLGTVQEEIGGHGAYAVHFEEKPGGVLIIDICGAEVFKLKENERRTIMGKGPILLDHPGTNQGFSRRLEELAVQNSIPFQRVGYYWRGADPSILQQKCGGLATMTIIIPMAYYHAPKGLINAIDVFNKARLLEAVLTDEEFLNFSSTF
jgi:putative aminopeptidase FrvX